jgi:L-asparaginase
MKLLLIHTGGTIGMVHGPNGLAPQKGLVEAAIEARLPAHVTLQQHVFSPLIDSADIGPVHWNEMLDMIDAHPDCPVIVVHGTDTMSFTGAALSQALEGQGRRIMLCGSMTPLGAGGDAEGNLDLAIDALVNGRGAGVFLSFAGRILPANGLVKHDCQNADAFRSIPQDPLTSARYHRFAERTSIVLTLAPGLPCAALSAALAQVDIAVLRVFGAGTIMSHPDISAALKQAVERGVKIRAVSQCEVGILDPGSYAAGAALWASGVQNGGRETPEAALIHLWLN